MAKRSGVEGMKLSDRILRGIPAVHRFGQDALRAYRGMLDSRRLKARLANEKAWRIVVGACGKCDKGWIPTEIQFLNLIQPHDWVR